MKIVRRGALPVGGDSGLLDIRARAMAPQDRPKGQSLGQVREENIWPRWVDAVLAFVDLEALAPLRVVIDAANGMAGVDAAPASSSGSRSRPCAYFFEPDGTFPNHEPNPLLPENREFIIGKTLEERRRPRRRLRRRRRPLLLRRRHRRVRPRRLRHGAARRVDPGEGARREDHLRRPGELGRPGDDRARRRRRRSSTASATPSSSTACARKAPRSAARSPATTTSATSRRPTRASCRSCSCSS